nr:immunoglobulin heavy chain junction region [Macaca mulatta]
CARVGSPTYYYGSDYPRGGLDSW